MADGTTGWIHEDMVDDDPPRALFVRVPEAAVRSSRLPMGGVVARLAAGTAVQQLARAGDSYQVRLADGRVGFVAKTAVTDDRPERVVVTIPQATLFSAPGRFARATLSVPYGTELVAFDEEDDHYLVRATDGSMGWVDEDCVVRTRL
jgi:SH3-like domain-containing protein